MEVYLKHGKWGGPYLTEKVEHKITECPRNDSRSGYGSRIPTEHMIKYRGKWRRVYAVCFSNVAVFYIRERVEGDRGIIVDFYE